jgi:F-type H+-transporting ATPase subunit delta
VPATSATATGLAQRYATALFDLAKDGRSSTGSASRPRRPRRLMDESPDLKRLVESPVISRADQGKAILALPTRPALDAADQRLSSAAHGRASPAFRAAGHRQGLCHHAGRAQGRGRGRGRLGRAARRGRPRDAEEVDRGFVGQAVTVETRVDPALLGGVVVRVGSRMLDASLRTKLMQLEQALKGHPRRRRPRLGIR